MKRNTKSYILCTILLASIFSFTAAGVETKLGTYQSASETGYTYGYRFFNGFEFDTYTPSGNGLEAILKAEAAEIKTEDKAAGRSYHVVVGHSQGGPRALGYATYTKKYDSAEYNRLQAVITMSGIDKGLKSLDGGRGTLISRLEKDIEIIFDGVIGCMRVNTFYSCNLNTQILTGNGSHAEICENIKNWLVDGVLPDNLSVWVKPALNTDYNLDEIAEIRDMIPRSNYLKTYVSDSTSHTYKVKTGREKVWKWRKGFLGLYYYTYEWENVYKMKTAYEDIAKFPEGIPVGYLVGMKSNTLSMMDDDDEDKIRDICDGAEIVMNVAGGLHVVQCVCIFGLFTGSNVWAADCFDAADWFGDIDGELNQLKGSDENDGLVAKESQYIPKTFKDPNTGSTRNVHTNVVGGGRNGYTEFPNHNHKSIRYGNNKDVMDEVGVMIYQSTDQRKR